MPNQFKKTNIFSILIVLAFGAVLYFYNNHPPNKYAKCPDDYPDTDAGSVEYLADFDKWTNDFYDNHPDAPLGDWNKARYEFWVKNGCTEAIERYNKAKSGEADTTEIDNIIREEINKKYE